MADQKAGAAIVVAKSLADVIKRVRLLDTAGLYAPPFGVPTLLEASPKSGAPWSLEFYKDVGVKASHPVAGTFVIPFSAIRSVEF